MLSQSKAVSTSQQALEKSAIFNKMVLNLPILVQDITSTKAKAHSITLLLARVESARGDQAVALAPLYKRKEELLKQLGDSESKESSLKHLDTAQLVAHINSHPTEAEIPTQDLLELANRLIAQELDKYQKSDIAINSVVVAALNELKSGQIITMPKLLKCIEKAAVDQIPKVTEQQIKNLQNEAQAMPLIQEIFSFQKLLGHWLTARAIQIEKIEKLQEAVNLILARDPEKQEEIARRLKSINHLQNDYGVPSIALETNTLLFLKQLKSEPIYDIAELGKLGLLRVQANPNNVSVAEEYLRNVQEYVKRNPHGIIALIGRMVYEHDLIHKVNQEIPPHQITSSIGADKVSYDKIFDVLVVINRVLCEIAGLMGPSHVKMLSVVSDIPSYMRLADAIEHAKRNPDSTTHEAWRMTKAYFTNKHYGISDLDSTPSIDMVDEVLAWAKKRKVVSTFMASVKYGMQSRLFSPQSAEEAKGVVELGERRKVVTMLSRVNDICHKNATQKPSAKPQQPKQLPKTTAPEHKELPVTKTAEELRQEIAQKERQTIQNRINELKARQSAVANSNVRNVSPVSTASATLMGSDSQTDVNSDSSTENVQPTRSMSRSRSGSR